MHNIRDIAEICPQPHVTEADNMSPALKLAIWSGLLQALKFKVECTPYSDIRGVKHKRVDRDCQYYPSVVPQLVTLKVPHV